MRPLTHAGWEWRPRRPDPEHRKCGRCRRTFYEGGVPPIDEEGPTAGYRICGDCRPHIPQPPPLKSPLF